jgi:hypothetical protein
VPGAFMTLISTGALEHALINVEPGAVGALIQHLHGYIQTTLGQDSEGGDSDDGLELGAGYLNDDRTEMIFGGARFDLFIEEGGEVSQIKGTKAGVGYRGIPLNQAYDNRVVPLNGAMTFYLTSDGLLDQVGGDRRRMYGKRRFRDLLSFLKDEPLTVQRDRILNVLVEYQSTEIRRDNVSVLGFRI